MNTTDFGKLLTNIRTQFVGLRRLDPKYDDCLRMLEFARNVHKGVRKDGVTNEFYHQLSIVGVLLTQHANLQNPHLVYQAAFGHDIIEDYPEHKEYMQLNFPEAFPYCWKLSKIRDGVKIPPAQYYREMGECPVASAVKPIDRSHNLSTMVKVFTDEKMVSYVAEVDDLMLPMLKRARINFPGQRDFYELTKSMLNDTCSLLKHFLGMDKVVEHDMADEEGLAR